MEIPKMLTQMQSRPLAGAASIGPAFQRLIALAQMVPLSLVQVMGRAALAALFWKAAQSKLASWPVTIQLFAIEYRVPLLPPELAAMLGTGVELIGAVLLFLGLMTRFAALALMGLVATIQIFVYPGSWAEHLMWASLLLLLVIRGPGVVSLDHLIGRWARAVRP
jgi:putative oxidoreductase